MSKLRVGIIGAGPVTQAIHLPALARVADDFEVAMVMDTVPEVAKAVAERAGAAAATRIEDIIDNPDVDVVAICSPHQFHAQQAIGACRAGKKAILCEKPFTLSVQDAKDVAEVSKQTAVPILLGTMHIYDDGWSNALAAWGDPRGSVSAIRSSIVLPPNPRMEDFATEVVQRPDEEAPDFSDPEVRAANVHSAVMAVAIHNIPHIRTFLEDEDVTIVDADCLPPWGYQIVAIAGSVRIEWLCRLYDTWRPDWSLEAFGENRALRVDFTPSYVQAGSATATLFEPGKQTQFEASPYNGYVTEWKKLARLARGEEPVPDLQPLVDDLALAMQVADKAADFVRSAK